MLNRNWKRLFFAVLPLLLMGIVTACGSSQDGEETVTATTGDAPAESTATLTSEPAKETEPSESRFVTVEVTSGIPEVSSSVKTTILETESANPFENTLLLVDDGRSDYQIVVHEYAADWEREAAEHVATLLQNAGATVAVSVSLDSETERSAREIVVGYSDRNDLLPENFFDVGDRGYHLLVQNERILIGANSAAGMAAAMEQFSLALIVSETRLGIKKNYVEKVYEQSESVADVKPTGDYADTIAYASDMANGVQAGYTDPFRYTFAMKNLNMAIHADLIALNNKTISALRNTSGIPYVTDTMSAYLVTNDGETYYSKNSTANGRVNIYRYGAYYYETHILDQNFGASYVIDESVEAYDILGKIRPSTGNNVSMIRKDKDGKLSYTIRSSDDPYLVLGSGLLVDADKYNAIQITMRADYSSSAQFYYAAGSKQGIDGSQIAYFNIAPGDEFQTYIVRLDYVDDYTGILRDLRIDVGTKAGETIEITEIKAVTVKDTNTPSMVVDRTLHTYSDKLNQVIHFVATDTVDSLSAYGMLTHVAADRVNKLIIIDKNGEHDSIDGVDWDSVVCVGFDIKRAGVFGYILTTAEKSGTLTVSLNEESGMYIIDQQVVAAAYYREGDQFYMGHRLYTDETHDFAGLRAAHYEEQNPLTEIYLTSEGMGAKVMGYDALRGAYRFDVNGTDFSTAYYNNPDLHYRIDAQISGDSVDRRIYVYSHTVTGALECAVVLDAENRLLPIDVEVCKNFKGENEEPIFDNGDMSYGEAYFPLVIQSHDTVSFSVLNLYQNWGKAPLKQISSIQFIAPYYHLSTGVTETNCIAPYYVYGKDYWTLPDFRSMSAPLWAGQPQHTSAGRLYFLEYTDAEGNFSASESTTDTVKSSGPVYADIDMDYISDDGRIAVQYRHMEMPQTDENRTYYEIRMTVLKDITFDNFKEDFSIFSMDGRAVLYEKLSYLDENDQPVMVDTNSGTMSKYITLGKNAPFFAYSYSKNSSDYVNMALIVKDWNITIGGETYTGNLILSDKKNGSLNTAKLTLDLEEVTLKAGDELCFSMVLLPWGSQQTAEDDYSHVLQVRQDTCLDPITTDVAVGTLIEDVFMPKVQAIDNKAEFTLSGGENNMAVRVYGFDTYAKPVIEEYIDGEWVTYEIASSNGYDGYAVYYDGDRAYSYAFIVSMTDGEARTFRVQG